VQGEAFALPLNMVRSIFRADRLNRVASNDELIGSIRYGRDEIPVFSLARIFNLPEAKLDNEHIVIFGTVNEPWGLLVEKTSQLGTVSTREIQPVPHTILLRNDFYPGILRTMNGVVVLLDPARISPSELNSSVQPLELPELVAPAPLPRPIENRNQILLASFVPDREGKRPLKFGFSALQVLELLELPEVIHLPRVGEEFLGLIEWRDRFIPLVDAGLLLGYPPFERGTRNRALILLPSGDRDPIAVPIQAGVRVIQGPLPHEPSPQTLNLNAEFFEVVVEFHDLTVVLMDADKLV
jgi:chemotaxis signal transduction protein